MPEICCILSMAVLVFSSHRTSGLSEQQFFIGKDPEARFHKILFKVLQTIPNHIDLGASRSELASHSNRKGASTYLLALCFINTAQVYLRAGWSLGVQDRYVIAGPGGDQLIGRAVSGLPIDGNDFSILPPHFSTADLIILNEMGFQNILDGYEKFPVSFLRSIPFLLASLVYHQDFLKDNLHASHPLFHQAIFTRRFQQLSNKTLVEFFKGKILLGTSICKDTQIRATGIPIHLAISNR